MIKIKKFYLTEDITNQEILSQFDKLDKEYAKKKLAFSNLFKLQISLLDIETCRYHDSKNIISFNVISLLFKNFKFNITLQPLLINKTYKKQAKLKIILKNDLSFSISGTNNIEIEHIQQFIDHSLKHRQDIIDYIKSEFNSLIIEYISIYLKAMNKSSKESFHSQDLYQNNLQQQDLLNEFNFLTQYMKADEKNLINIPFLVNDSYLIFTYLTFGHKEGKYYERDNPLSFFDENELFTLFKNSFYFNNQFYFGMFATGNIQNLKHIPNLDEMITKFRNNQKLIRELNEDHKYNTKFLQIYFLNQEINNF